MKVLVSSEHALVFSHRLLQFGMFPTIANLANQGCGIWLMGSYGLEGQTSCQKEGALAKGWSAQEEGVAN